jgi:hypothetical protein
MPHHRSNNTADSSSPDTAEIRSMIDRVRGNAGSQWAQTVHFWCEAPRPNLPDDPAITPDRDLRRRYIIGNHGMVVYVLRTSRAGDDRRLGDTGWTDHRCATRGAASARIRKTWTDPSR